MPTDVGRALSIQQQYALELIAQQAGAVAAELFRQRLAALTPADADRISSAYSVVLLGAMQASAQTRAGYLQAFATAEGQPLFDIPVVALRPTTQDVMVGGRTAIPPARGVGADIPPLAQQVLRAPSDEGAMWATLARLEKNLAKGVPDAIPMAQAQIIDYTESSVMGAADYVDAMVLSPSQAVAALRRVAHPGACDRCQAVSGVLVYKTFARLRHPQCRCSFEPVLLTDPEYQGRLAKYEGMTRVTAGGPGGSAWARRTRYEGRQRLAAAEARLGQYRQEEWALLLKEEQKRLGDLVTAIPSNQYRDWAIMTSAKTTELGGDFLPVITRN